MLAQYVALTDGIIDDVKLSLFDRADKVFKSYTHIETDILVGDVLNNNGSTELTNMLDDIYTFVEEGLDYISNEIGITFSESATILEKIHLLEVFKQAEDFEDSDTLVRLMESEHTAKLEIALDVLAHVAGCDYTVFAESIEDVSVDTIQSIYSIHSERLDKIEEQKYIRQNPDLGRILMFIDRHPHTIISDGIKNGGYRPGLPLKPLLRENLDKLIALYPENPKQVARDIMGLLLIGNVPTANLGDLGRTVVERIFKKPEFVSLVNAEINILANEVINA